MVRSRLAMGLQRALYAAAFAASTKTFMVMIVPSAQVETMLLDLERKTGAVGEVGDKGLMGDRLAILHACSVWSRCWTKYFTVYWESGYVNRKHQRSSTRYIPEFWTLLRDIGRE